MPAASSADGGRCIDRSEARCGGDEGSIASWSAAWRAWPGDGCEGVGYKKIISWRAVNLLKTARSQQDLSLRAVFAADFGHRSQGTPQLTDQRWITSRRTRSAFGVRRGTTRRSHAGFPRELWIVLHGYGQLARRFLAAFQGLDDGSRLVVAPEALSRFYLDPVSERRQQETPRVGATWMTREDRLAEIEDYIAYLEQLTMELRHHLAGAGPRIVVLGFSQGTATLCRWLAASELRADQIVLWAGGIPPELDVAEWSGLHDAPLTLVAGESTRWCRERRGGRRRTPPPRRRVHALHQGSPDRPDALVRLAEGFEAVVRQRAAGPGGRVANGLGSFCVPRPFLNSLPTAPQPLILVSSSIDPARGRASWAALSRRRGGGSHAQLLGELCAWRRCPTSLVASPRRRRVAPLGGADVTMCSYGPRRMRTSSPVWGSLAGLARSPATRTCRGNRLGGERPRLEEAGGPEPRSSRTFAGPGGPVTRYGGE